MSVQNIPAEQMPFKYIYGLQISNNATTPYKIVDVAIGQCRDSNDDVDMVYSAATSVSALVNGLNGLDTGSLTTSSFYKIFAISDSSNKKPAGFIMTLATNTAPVVPLGYDSSRLIGFVLTDSGSNILPFSMSTSASGNLRYIQYGTPLAVTVTSSGTATTYTSMSLTTGVPNSNFDKVKIYAKWDPNAAADVLNLQPTGLAGDLVVNTAVSTTVQDFIVDILPLLSSGVPKISYKVSTGSATLTAVTVMGYDLVV